MIFCCDSCGETVDVPEPKASALLKLTKDIENMQIPGTTLGFICRRCRGL